MKLIRPFQSGHAPFKLRNALALGVGGLLLPFLPPIGVPTAALATTVTETTGGVTHTWTNYSNAGGSEGPTIPSRDAVQVTCKLTGFKVANGNTWWYQIGSDPWNNKYYASADAFYNNGATAGSLQGTPFVDNAVPDCGSAPPLPPPLPVPAPVATITLAQGPSAPQGYRYAITLNGFAKNATASINCYDSVSKSGFYTFDLKTDSQGHAETAAYCYSEDGPDHWVIASGTESNHVTRSTAGGGSGTTGGNIGSTVGDSSGNNPGGSTNPPPQGVSVFYSGNEMKWGDSRVTEAPADINLTVNDFGDNCAGNRAVPPTVGYNITTLSGWSRGRMGPIYFLAKAGQSRVDQVRRIVLFDPGSTSDMDPIPGWHVLYSDLVGKPQPQPCDPKFDIASLLANWLKSNGANHLLIFTGMKSEQKPTANAEPQYTGLWRYWLGGMWKQPFADRALICNYDEMGHPEVLVNFYKQIKAATFECPKFSGGTEPWHP